MCTSNFVLKVLYAGLTPSGCSKFILTHVKQLTGMSERLKFKARQIATGSRDVVHMLEILPEK